MIKLLKVLTICLLVLANVTIPGIKPQLVLCLFTTILAN